MKITSKHGELIGELAEGRTEITTKMICDAESLYFIRKRTLVDGPNGLEKPKKCNYLPRLLPTQYDAHKQQQSYLSQLEQQQWMAERQSNHQYFGLGQLGGIGQQLLGI